jgi:hypothetical protein
MSRLPLRSAARACVTLTPQPRGKRSWDDVAHSARLTCACAASDCPGLYSK